MNRGRGPGTAARRARCALLTAGLATVLATGGCASLGGWITTPSQPYDAYTAPPAPDYAQPESWAARPGMRSPALEVPPGLAPGEAQWTELVHVFFLHPTTYFWRFAWNAGIHGWLANRIVDVTLRDQASAFNAAGRIFAPRYRQLTLSGFLGHPEAMEKGLALAYSDVRRAFQYFLDHENEGRPILLVGHSQGSRLLLRLLDEFYREGDLRERLVAAYPIGTRTIQEGDRQKPGALPICRTPEQSGCLISWRTFAPGSPWGPGPDEDASEDVVCINPLTWRHDQPVAPASANLGSLPVSIFSLSRPEPALVGTHCAHGALWIVPPPGWPYSFFAIDGDYHAEDFSLFYVNLRENAIHRTRSFLRRHEP
ncbi:MAG: DUF3089 domain-containing protein [Myxococcota bacterium]